MILKIFIRTQERRWFPSKEHVSKAKTVKTIKKKNKQKQKKTGLELRHMKSLTTKVLVKSLHIIFTTV